MQSLKQAYLIDVISTVLEKMNYRLVRFRRQSQKATSIWCYVLFTVDKIKVRVRYDPHH